MDKFKSAIFVRDMSVDVDDNDRPIGLNISHDLFGNDGDEPVPDDLFIDTAEWGWWDGGLAALLTSAYRQDIYFRGTSMFASLDDAKDDYLTNPEIDMPVDGVYGYHPEHTPFGVVIPNWIEPSNGIEGKCRLGSVTIILWWQELT